ASCGGTSARCGDAKPIRVRGGRTLSAGSRRKDGQCRACSHRPDRGGTESCPARACKGWIGADRDDRVGGRVWGGDRGTDDCRTLSRLEDQSRGDRADRSGHRVYAAPAPKDTSFTSLIAFALRSSSIAAALCESSPGR